MKKTLFSFHTLLVYGNHWLRNVTKNSIFFWPQELPMCSLFPEKLLKEVIRMYAPKRVVDVGCGTGKSLDYFLSQGIDAVGVEGSFLAINHARHPEKIIRFNLNKEFTLHKRYDLVWAFEFIEHIHPVYLNNLMKTFVNLADVIVLSAARPNQGGSGHFNEQNDAYWIHQFAGFGFTLNHKRTNALRRVKESFSKNMYVFEKSRTKTSYIMDEKI